MLEMPIPYSLARDFDLVHRGAFFSSFCRGWGQGGSRLVSSSNCHLVLTSWRFNCLLVITSCKCLLDVHAQGFVEFFL